MLRLFSWCHQKMSFFSKWLYIFALKKCSKRNLPLLLHLSSKSLILSSVKIVKGINQQRYTINYSHCSVFGYLLMTLLNLSLALDSKIIFFYRIRAYNLSFGYNVIAYLRQLYNHCTKTSNLSYIIY